MIGALVSALQNSVFCAGRSDITCEDNRGESSAKYALLFRPFIRTCPDRKMSDLPDSAYLAILAPFLFLFLNLKLL